MDEGNRITALAEIPADTTFLFTVREIDTGEEREAVLVKLGGDGGTGGDSGEGGATIEAGEGGEAVAGWLNHCQHFTHIRLDRGAGAEMRDGEIVCTNHGAMFEAETGLCTFGPCEGAYLDRVDVSVRDGDVFLTDAKYEFVRVGPEDVDRWDLTSTSNVEF